jgi:hypothetical protein
LPQKKQIMYPEDIVAPMWEDLPAVGFTETRTPETETEKHQ